MTTIKVNFYYIKSDFKILVRRLCERLIKNNYKVLIKVGSRKEEEELDNYLWSYDDYSFLPHRTELDEFDNDEKIIIFIISPSVSKTKIIPSCNHFFFSYLNPKNNFNNKTNKLKNTRFIVKTLIEEKNQKWKIC